MCFPKFNNQYRVCIECELISKKNYFQCKIVAAWLNLGSASKARKWCFTYETPREYSAVIIKFEHFDHKISSKISPNPSLAQVV